MKLATTTEDFCRFCPTYLEQIKQVHKAGFQHIDLSLYNIKQNDELILSDNWQKTVEEIKEYAQANNIQFVQSHSPGINPLDPSQLETAVKWNVRAIEVCGALGIPNMVVHAGYDLDATKEEWFKGNKAFFERLFDAMEKYNVNVLHENSHASNELEYYYPRTGAEMVEFSNCVNHPKFHSCWDTGHANTVGMQYEEILALGDDLYAIHFNDNRGRVDEHLIPYMGTMNVDEVMCALKDVNYKGCFTFEVSGALRSKHTWFGTRSDFSKSKLLLEPTLEMQADLEKFIYSLGKHILTAYGEFEG